MPFHTLMYYHNRNMETTIVSAFPGTGKTTFYNKYKENLLISDSDSSTFPKGEEWPQNYIDHIKSLVGKQNIIFVSSHKEVRDALKENNIHYTLVYPSSKCKEEYIERFKQRGNSEDFVNLLEKHYESWILDDLILEDYPDIIMLNKGEYLSKIFDII